MNATIESEILGCLILCFFLYMCNYRLIAITDFSALLSKTIIIKIIMYKKHRIGIVDTHSVLLVSMH